jgi:hypothetical protein
LPGTLPSDFPDGFFPDRSSVASESAFSHVATAPPLFLTNASAPSFPEKAHFGVWVITPHSLPPMTQTAFAASISSFVS